MREVAAMRQTLPRASGKASARSHRVEADAAAREQPSVRAKFEADAAARERPSVREKSQNQASARSARAILRSRADTWDS